MLREISATSLLEGLCRKCKVSAMLAAQCSHCAWWKNGLCCHHCTKDTEHPIVMKRGGYLCAAVHHQYHHPRVSSFGVCFCCSAVSYSSSSSPPAGSAMSGLDGLIGAEERIINSKPKISDNVVRASFSSSSFCAWFFEIFDFLTCSPLELRAVLLKPILRRDCLKLCCCCKSCILQLLSLFNFITTTSGRDSCADDWN